ncbi:phosphotransferase [Actinoplanes sp. NPDC049548]|uniref:phosphotransferase family protein n=1 Tax=Actinoplanes sp. NPDC049548 TaxID=3155152 RepID=UPI0034294CAA
MTELRQVHDDARAIAEAALGRDPGPLTTAESISHRVYVGADIVVKVIDAAGHSRLDREIALVPHLPGGLTAPLLAAGLHGQVRYACYARVPGKAPGMGMPAADAATARSLAVQAVQRLHALHDWVPAGEAERTLREPLDHGGFVGRAELIAEIERLTAADRKAVVPAAALDRLTAIAESAPPNVRMDVPVHADCHWGNWLASGSDVTALLDFEWARFGDPVDDWFFVIADSGPHVSTVLEVVARETTTSSDTLRAQCEVREAAYLASDVRPALTRPDFPPRMFGERLRRLKEITIGRAWWR